MAKTSCKKGQYYCNTDQKCKPIPDGYKVREDGILVSEGSLHKWFKGSKSKDGKPGWVQSDGSPCANEPGETKTPKCYSSAKRASMSKKELRSADARKSRQDPGQQQKRNAASPTYVKTDKPKKKKKMKEEFISLPLQLEVPQNDGEFRLGLMFRESLEQDRGMLFVFETTDRHSFHMKNTFIPLDIAFINEEGVIESIKELNPMSSVSVYPNGKIRYAIEVNRGWFAENGVVVGDTILEEGCEVCGESCDGCECECHDTITEVKDRKGKGSGKKDACYHKVKSRYSVWPSAYASGALVKCRKVGAANWGNSRKEEVEYEAKVHKTPHYRWRDALEEHHQKDKDGNPITHEGGSVPFSGKGDREGNPIEESKSNWRQELDEKCWKGYEKKGMKTMFGKRYPNCVKKTKKEEFEVETSSLDEKLVHGAFGNYIKNQKLPKNTEKKYKEPPYKDLAASNEIDGELTEKTMTSAQKRKDTMLKKKYDDSDMKKNMIAQYGKEEGTKIYFAKIRKEAMKEDTAIESELVIQDWNVDEIKYTEVEAVDIIKPEPLKPSPSNWRMDLGEDWQKVNRKDKTDGMSKAAVKAYRKENPGSKLKTAVTKDPKKLKKGSKSAKRRLSFCRRMRGMKKKLTSAKTSRDPDSRINKALRRWNC